MHTHTFNINLHNCNLAYLTWLCITSAGSVLCCLHLCIFHDHIQTRCVKSKESTATDAPTAVPSAFPEELRQLRIFWILFFSPKRSRFSVWSWHDRSVQGETEDSHRVWRCALTGEKEDAVGVGHSSGPRACLWPAAFNQDAQGEQAGARAP